MNKKFFSSAILGLMILSNSCSAEIIEKIVEYKDNQIKIPQVVGIKPAAAKKINDYIVKNIAKEPKKFIDSSSDCSAWLYTTVVRDDDKYLSLRIASASYYKGAAHPNAYMHGLVFDKATGKKLPLSYFVEMPPKDHLEGYVRSHVFKLYSSGDKQIELEPSARITHISEEYTLDENDNIDLYYQQYELGAYAIGSPYIRLDKVYVDCNGHVLPKG